MIAEIIKKEEETFSTTIEQGKKNLEDEMRKTKTNEFDVREAFKLYETYGFGLWAVILKNTKEMIGQAGLTLQPYKDTEVLEIGYLLKEKFWHYGYAREAAAGCKKYAFEVLKQDKVCSVIKVDNTSSIRVAESIGMRKEDTFIARYYNGDMLHYLYSVQR